MKNEIGIGILDLYTEEDLEKCYDSIPEEYKQGSIESPSNIFIVSNNNNKTLLRDYVQQKKYTTRRKNRTGNS